MVHAMEAEQRDKGGGGPGDADGGGRQREQHDGRAPGVNASGGYQAAEADEGDKGRTQAPNGTSTVKDGPGAQTLGSGKGEGALVTAALQTTMEGRVTTKAQRLETEAGAPCDGETKTKHGGAGDQGVTAKPVTGPVLQPDGQDHSDAGQPERHKVPSLEDAFEQLKALMVTTSKMPIGADWPERVEEVFTMIYNSTAIKEKSQKADEGYPALSTNEAVELLDLFQRIVIRNKRPMASWKRSVSDLCRDMHRSTWSVTALIRKYVGQARLDPEPTSGAWGRPRPTQEAPPTDSDRPKFTFHGDEFPPERQAEILRYCKQPFEFPTKLREPTPLEWEIVLALMEGKIIARHLPQFLRRICNAKNLLRFQNAIVA